MTAKEKKKNTSTAGYICFSRACATREKDPALRGPDDMARIFLPGFASVILNVPILRQTFMQRVAPEGIYEYVSARTKFFDEFFVDALKKGFDQIVILGAGMDTRAMRFASLNQGTRIFELDLPKIQGPKLEILKRKKVSLPDDLVFVPIDFNTQDLSTVLQKAGYQENRKTLFLMEGVSMYLEAQAVDRTLNFIRSSTQSGSQIVFDYIYASVVRREESLFGEKGAYETVANIGERWIFGIEKDGIEDFLSEHGLNLLEHFTPAEMEQKYLAPSNGSRARHINGTHCIVCALVP